MADFKNACFEISVFFRSFRRDKLPKTNKIKAKRFARLDQQRNYQPRQRFQQVNKSTSHSSQPQPASSARKGYTHPTYRLITPKSNLTTWNFSATVHQPHTTPECANCAESSDGFQRGNFIIHFNQYG